MASRKFHIRRTVARKARQQRAWALYRAAIVKEGNRPPIHGSVHFYMLRPKLKQAVVELYKAAQR